MWRPRLAGYEDATVSASVRLEHIDLNIGTFESTGASIGDEESAVVVGLSFRPTAGTVFRVNYRYHWSVDFPRNDPVRGAGFQLGFATYF